MTRNELLEQISELIASGDVVVDPNGKSRNQMLDEIVVLYGGVSNIHLNRNALLEEILRLATP
jgi:hypothetical protein